MILFQRVIIALVAIFSLTFTACKKDNFDEPPHETVDPNLPVTHTIRELKDLFLGTNLKLTDDITIAGVVVANDKSGNIFNQIIIDDGSAGISVAIDQNALFGEFPVGRKIYVHCKDLYLAADNNLIGLYGGIDLAGSTVEIPSTLITKYIVKANAGNLVVPIEVNDIDRLNDSFQNRLVKLSNVEFTNADADQPYADAVNKSSLSRFLTECDGDEIEVRSSGYADFAAVKTPKGKGSITGVYTVYRTDKQLVLRDANETDMNGLKCDGSDPSELTLFSENFDGISGTNNAILNIPNWKNIAQTNSVQWQNAIFSSVKCAKAESFNPPNGPVVSWLITPQINLGSTTSKKIKFSFAPGRCDGASSFKVLVSSDYDGGNSPQNFTWTTLVDTICTVPTSSFGTLAPFRTLDISSFSGNIFVAFKYQATESGGQNTVYEIDDVKITGL